RRFAYKAVTVFVDGEDQRSAFRKLFVYQHFGKQIFDIFLDGTLQRSCAEIFIPAFLCNEVFRILRKLNLIVKFFKSLIQLIKFKIDNFRNMIFFKIVEYHDIIDTVQKFWRKSFLQCIFYRASRTCIAGGLFGRCTETYTITEIFKVTCTDIRRENDDRISEINLSTE